MEEQLWDDFPPLTEAELEILDHQLTANEQANAAQALIPS